MVEKEVTHLESSDSDQSEPEDEEEEILQLIRSLKQQEIGSSPKSTKPKRPLKEEPPGLRPRPTAPPPYDPPPSSWGSASSISFCPEVWREVATAYPVFVDPANNNQRYHEPLDFKVIKNLAESVRAYGVGAAFTVTQIENLNWFCLTPSDWAQLTRSVLSPGQYLDWKSLQYEFACEQAAINLNAGLPQAAWDRDMLLGQGRTTNHQINLPDQVYTQINNIAIRAWKALPNKGEVTGNLTKIIQGPTEPFSDFVARLVQVAGRIFGNADTAMPLIKQLAFEQCTKECRQAINPYKNKGIEAWMKI